MGTIAVTLDATERDRFRAISAAGRLMKGNDGE